MRGRKPEAPSPEVRRLLFRHAELRAAGAADHSEGPFPVNRPLPLEILACPSCGRMDFIAHEERRRLLGPGDAKPEIRLCHVCRREAFGSERCPYCGAMPKSDRRPML